MKVDKEAFYRRAKLLYTALKVSLRFRTCLIFENRGIFQVKIFISLQ